MKSDLFFYLSAGFNVGALSSVLFRIADSRLPSKKEIATLVLSSLAAASSVGYILSKKESDEMENDYIDTKEDTAHKLEMMLV